MVDQEWWAETARKVSAASEGAAFAATSPSDSIPTIQRFSSITGSRRICFRSMIRTASSRSSLALQKMIG